MITSIKKIMMTTLVLLVTAFLGACINQEATQYEYKVLTMQAIEKAIFESLIAADAAERDKENKDKLHIKDVEKAKSQNSMPVFLDKLGADGWELTAINENQLYVFRRAVGEKKHPTWTYKVLALTDINKLIVKHLKTFNAVEELKDKPGEYKITDTEKAKSQFIMPRVLNDMGQQGWTLTGVNQASLYIFTKRIPDAGWSQQLKKATH